MTNEYKGVKNNPFPIMLDEDVGVMKNAQKALAHSMMSQKEDLLKKAINSKIGTDWKPEEKATY